MASAALLRRRGPRPAPQPVADVAALPSGNPTALIIGAMMASLLQVLDATIANVALPHMQAALGATPDTVTWVLTSYIIATAVAMPITGWLADRFGARRLFLLAVTGFVGASMLCGVSQNMEQMVAFRVLQGISGAFIPPLSQSFMLDSSRPSRHPQVMAIWSAGIMIGPIVGPVLGGVLTESGSWRWVFYVNVPVGALALAMLAISLPARPQRERRFDLGGFATIALGLCAAQLLLDRGPTIDWFQSAEAWIYAGVVVSAMWMAVIHFSTTRNPLFEPTLFADRNFIIAFGLMLAVGCVLFATMALLPPMLQHLFGYDVIDTGLVLAPRGIGVLISMQISGLLLRKGLDPRAIVISGFLLTAYALWQMAHWSLAVDPWNVVVTGLVQGLGIGLVFIPLNTTAFATLPPRLRTDGSSMLNLSRNVGSSIGISVVAALLASNIQRIHEELGARISPAIGNLVDFSTIDRFQAAGDLALRLADAEVNRQAAMVAYVNDFWLMMWLTLAVCPFVLLMRRNVIAQAGS